MIIVLELVPQTNPLSPGEGMDDDGGAGLEGATYPFPLARDVFVSERSRALLAQVENDSAGDRLGYRVRVRVMRGGPNWRVEVGVFARRLPLFPRLKSVGRGPGGVMHMQVAHGNRTAFQELLERILGPIHLATLSEGAFQTALLARARDHIRPGSSSWDPGGQSHWINERMATASMLTDPNQSLYSAEGIGAPVSYPSMEGGGEPGSTTPPHPQPQSQPQSPRAPGENPSGTASTPEYGHVMAKLLVSFFLEEIWVGEPDFNMQPFIRMHYTPNLGHISWLALRDDPEVNETPDQRIGSNLREYLEYCQGRWGSHHSVTHMQHVDMDGQQLEEITEVGLLRYTKAQGTRERPRDTFPVVGYVQWDIVSYDAVVNFFTERQVGIGMERQGGLGPKRLRDFYRCVDGLGDTPRKALNIVREIARGEKDASAIALFLYGHTWNAGKHFARLINAHHLYTQPQLMPGGVEYCMNRQISCELAKIGTGRRSRSQVLFEHILLSSTFEDFQRRFPEYLPSLIFGSRHVLVAPSEDPKTLDLTKHEEHWTTSVDDDSEGTEDDPEINPDVKTMAVGTKRARPTDEDGPAEATPDGDTASRDPEPHDPKLS